MSRTIAMGACLCMLIACTTVPVTDGFHKTLPIAGTRTVVWGNHSAVTATATTWVLHQGLAVIEHAKVREVLAESPDFETSSVKEVAVLNAAKRLGAQTVVFATQSGDVRAPMVSVRGIELDSSQIAWSGHARYPAYVKRPFSDLLTELTCQALATAWGKMCDEKDKPCC
jgi:hypothetical protein